MSSSRSASIALTAASLLGIDLDEQAIERAREGMGPQACEVELQAADVVSLTLPPESLDVVVFTRSL